MNNPPTPQSLLSLADRCEVLEKALAKAAAEFREHEQFHAVGLEVHQGRSKPTILKKIARSREMAEMCEAALRARSQVRS